MNQNSIHTKMSPMAHPKSALIDHRALIPEYVTGLCEGESSFTYSRNGGGINLRFGIKIDDGDKNLIFAIQGYFGVGSVYFTEKPTGGGSWYYCVSSQPELERIIDHFNNYPFVGKKREKFKIWSQMHSLKKTPRDADLSVLNDLAQKLSSMSSRGRRTA